MELYKKRMRYNFVTTWESTYASVRFYMWECVHKSVIDYVLGIDPHVVSVYRKVFDNTNYLHNELNS
jgi:hypothetical protein